MAENDSPAVPPTTPAASTGTPPSVAPPPAAKKKAQEYDPAHVPMGEEFDRAKWTMPGWQPVVIALVIVAAAVAFVGYFNRSKPPAVGAIDQITAVSIPGDSTMVAVTVHFKNATDHMLYIRNVKSTLETAKGEFTDDAANASDYARYYEAFPSLKENSKPPIIQDTQVAKGASGIGTVIFSYPITKDVFDGRQSLTVTVQPYDQPAIVLKK
ncbi:MAG: hypothetical protein ACRD3E_15320 [Terriglobales bacterium]